MRARWRALLCGVPLAVLCGCWAGRNETYPNDFYKPVNPVNLNSPAAQPASGANDITGVWEGTSIADCFLLGAVSPGRCRAVQNITLTMFQQGNAVTGFYKCAFGTQVCRNMDENGVIRNGLMNGRRLMMRVMLEDGSMCFFTGMPVNDRLDGRYMCLQGAGIVEKGVFRTDRSY